MCLENAKRIKCEHDIVCYKVAYGGGNGCYITPYNNYEFSLGKNVHTPSIKKGKPALFTFEREIFNGIFNTDGTLDIESGVFHSFKNKSDAIIELHYLKSFKRRKFVSSPEELNRTLIADFACLIECCIPAGSIVFEGKYGERKSYASNKIIFKKEISIPLKDKIKHFFKKII